MRLAFVMLLLFRSVRTFAPPISSRAVRTGNGLKWGEEDDVGPSKPPQDDGEFSFTRRRSSPSSAKGSRGSGSPRQGGNQNRRFPPREGQRRGSGNDHRRRPDFTSDRRISGQDFRRRRDFGDFSGGEGGDDPDNVRRFRSPPRQGGRDRDGAGGRPPKEDDPTRINLKLLTDHGFEHLYGLSPVFAALTAAMDGAGRDFSTADAVEGDDEFEDKSRPSVTLFVQSRTTSSSTRSPAKEKSASSILTLAEALNIPTVQLDKGTMNSMTNSRPHQGEERSRSEASRSEASRSEATS